MKRNFFYFLIFVFVLALISCFPRKVNANNDLVIPEWVVDAQILENGDLQIIEDITFKFNDYFNGVFREIVLNKTSGIADISVQELVGTALKEYNSVEDAENGDSDVFLINKNEDRAVIKIFSPSEDEVKTFRISYVVKNVAVKYNDTGELYYKFLGDENKTPIQKFKVYIKFPQSISNEEVKVFAHGPSNGKINIENDTTYSLYVEDVPANTFVEGRIVFPKEFIPLSNNIKNIDNLSNILEEEKIYQNKLIEERERKEKLRNILEQVLIFLAGLGLTIFIIFLILFRRNKYIYQNKEYYTGDIPEDCTPAVAAYLTGAMIYDKFTFATILDLIRKGYIKISKSEKDKNEDYIISKVKEIDDSLLDHEKYFINLLINQIGNGHSVTTAEIQSFSKNNEIQYLTLFSEWRNKIKKDAVDKGYYDKSKTKYGIICILLSVALFVVSIFVLVMEVLYGIAGIIISVIIFIYGLTLINRLTDYGYMQYKKWKEFKKYMKYYDLDLSRANVDKYSSNISLIYALALGLNKKISTFDVNEDFDANGVYLYNGWFYWYILLMNNQNNSFKKSMNESFSSSNGSYSGGSSFTGGGGAGAGGGGAGGF